MQGVRDAWWIAFERRLWQRNYYERVIRNERELNAVREYVTNYPLQWALDRENPQR
jgi:REP element-mobilizing transposase RayT